MMSQEGGVQQSFVSAVKEQFQFLVDEFGFELIKATESPRGEPWEGKVEYVSHATLIVLSCTRGEIASLDVGRAKDQGKHLLPIRVLYEYMTLSPEEKRIVLSISEGRTASNILYKHPLLDLPDELSINESRKRQLDAFAQSLREYALPLLKDDFSSWLPICEYAIEKLTVEWIRTGRPHLIPVQITDENGTWKTIGKQHVFQKSLDYIQALRDEYNTP